MKNGTFFSEAQSAPGWSQMLSEALPLNFLGTGWRYALQWALKMPRTHTKLEVQIGKNKRLLFRSFVLIIDLNYNFISYSLNCAVLADARFQPDLMELQQLRSRETFYFYGAAWSDLLLTSPLSSKCFTEWSFWWRISFIVYSWAVMETGVVQSGQDREGSDVPLSLDPPLPSRRETSSRKAAVEDTSEGGCETGWRTMWSRGQSTRMGVCFARGARCGFGEALAHDVFVFLGFSSGPGVPAAVGSLLGHQCLALLPCPGSLQRRGAPRQHPSKSLSPFKAMCAAESVSGPTIALGGPFPVGKALPGCRAAQRATALQRSLCAHKVFLNFSMLQPSR